MGTFQWQLILSTSFNWLLIIGMLWILLRGHEGISGEGSRFDQCSFIYWHN